MPNNFHLILSSLIWLTITFATSCSEASGKDTKELRKRCISSLKTICSTKGKGKIRKRISCYKKSIKYLPSKCRDFATSYYNKVSNNPKAKELYRAKLMKIVGLVLGLLILIVCSASLAKLFHKANYPYWAAFIPFYNLFIFHKIAATPIFWFVANLSPAFIVFWPKSCLAFAASFEQSKRQGILLCLFPFIILPLWALNKNIVFQGRGKLPKLSLDLDF